MIIQKQKPFEEIVKALEGEGKIFIAGCADCATTCKVGGEEEVAEMKKKLEAVGKTVTGTTVVDTCCLSGKVRELGRAMAEAVNTADSILVLACGTGVQTIGDHLKKRVHPGCDSLFIGEVVRMGKYVEKCTACGQCILEDTEGICPVTRCSKGLLNGPCGGYRDGKCEVDPEKDCAWMLIYEQLKARGKLDKLARMAKPKNFSTAHTPRTYEWKRPEPVQGKKGGES